MTSSLVKYALAFFLGAIFAYLIFAGSNKQSELSSSTSIADDSLICEESFEGNGFASGLSAADEAFEESDQAASDDSAAACIAEIEEYKQELQIVELKSQAAQDTLLKQLSDTATENAMLKERLQRLEPSNVDDAELKDLVLEPFNESVIMFPENVKQELYDFHTSEEDPDWGYNKQQQISDFIRSHLNFQAVNLLSVICKAGKCEVAMSEKVTAETMAQAGASAADIQTFIDTQPPAYKAIFDDLQLSLAINMRTGVHMPGRFDIYMLLIDKGLPD